MYDPEYGDNDLLKQTGVLRRLSPCRDCSHGPHVDLGNRLCGAFRLFVDQSCNAEWEWEMLPAGGLTDSKNRRHHTP